MSALSRRKKKITPRRLSFDVLEERRVLSAVFSPTESTLFNHGLGFTLTTLCDGKVLAVGGSDGVSILRSAEVYDPASGSWNATGSMNTARGGQIATLLPNCKVLVAGGYGINSAELYDPISGTWSPTGSMATARADAVAALLNNGKVLVAAGGVPGPGDTYGTASAELYDPTSGTWSPTGSLNTARLSQVGLSLSDGRVLVAGGMDRGVTFQNFSSTEVYDPALGSWSTTGSMAIGRRGSFTLTTLPSGEVLVAGGGTNWTAIGTDKAELFDPNTGIWTPTTSLPATRQAHSATLLLDGTVLVAGGNEHPVDFGPGTTLDTALIYDPVNASWTPTTNMGEVRGLHRDVLLADGNVLIVGGHNGSNYLTTAERYGDACVPAPSGLVSWWSGEGDATDRTGQHDGTLVNGVTFAPGRVGQAFHLDGIDDYLRIPHDPALNLAAGMTIEAWINSESTTGPRVIASKWNDGTSEWSYIFKDHNSNDKLRIELSRDVHNDLADLSGTTSITPGTWIHAAATFDGSTVRLYFNGVEDASLNVGPNERIDASMADFLIGAGFAADGVREHFAGLIDELAVYNRALNGAEIRAIHGAGGAGKCINRQPIAVAGGPYSVPEGGSVALNGAGSFDPDGDTLAYSWDLDDDGTFETSGVAPTFFAAGRDGPGSQTVVLRVSDGSVSVEDTAIVNVTNISPTATVSNDGPVSEGSESVVTFTAQFDPSTTDTIAGFHYAFDLNNDGVFDLGDGTYAGSVTTPWATVPASLLDDGPGAREVAARIIDRDGGFTDYKTTISVNNVAPTIDSLSLSGNVLVEGQTVVVMGTFSDLGAGDTHTATVVWDDGESSAANVNQGDGTFTAAHVYASGGVFTITVTLTDDDGGSAVASTTSWVTGVRLTDEGVLEIVGTDGRDRVAITLDRDGGSDQSRDTPMIKVKAKFDQGGSDGRADFRFAADEVHGIYMMLGAGDDLGQIGRDGGRDVGLNIPAFIDGGAGNDYLSGGSGNDTLIGGPGNDKLKGRGGNDTLLGDEGDDDLDGGDGDDVLSGGDGDDKLNGGDGRNVLIGGRGKDDLKGGKGDDLLIGGFTSYDGHVANLTRIMAEWRSERSYEDRVGNLRNGTGVVLSGTSVKLQASGLGRTVFDDGMKDKIKGHKNRDWFFASLQDELKDNEQDEELELL